MSWFTWSQAGWAIKGAYVGQLLISPKIKGSVTQRLDLQVLRVPVAGVAEWDEERL